LVKRGVAGAPRVALTFDDGPHEMTDAYLDVLDRFGARATFFVVGRECEKHPEALLRIVARGHEVAGHGFTHTAFTDAGCGCVAGRAGAHRRVAPAGGDAAAAGAAAIRGDVDAVSGGIRAGGYTSVMWSADSDDCRTSSPADVAARLAPDVLSPGDIVLLHDAQDWTLAALPPALEALAAAGWQAVTWARSWSLLGDDTPMCGIAGSTTSGPARATSATP
jgi:peptidoglycan/xylan/chitin deacetylase (PgdA/CDA1 family)